MGTDLPAPARSMFQSPGHREQIGSTGRSNEVGCLTRPRGHIFGWISSASGNFVQIKWGAQRLVVRKSAVDLNIPIFNLQSRPSSLEIR